MAPTPPVSPPSWVYDAALIQERTTSAITNATAFLDSIAALKKEERNFESVVRPLALREAEMAEKLEPALFLQYVDARDDVREESVKADKKIQEFDLVSSTRTDVYEALLDAKKNIATSGVKLSPEESRLLDRYIRDRTRNGLGLSQEDRDKFVAIKNEINSLSIDFSKACNEEKGFLLFTAEELDGVPAEVISGYPKEGDKYRVTYKTPDITPVFKYAKLSSTRRAAQLGYESKTSSNTPLLSRIILLRREAAALLSFDDWASFILDVKMAKTKERVFEFLADLEQKLGKMARDERGRLLELKKEIEGEEAAKEFYLWDYRFYDNLYVERKLKLDQQKVKEYFPVSKVVPKILDIYRRLLNVEFFPVSKTEGGQTWHQDAEMYAVWSGGENGQQGEFLGYMHLDLFPRENKYGHAAVWGLIPGFTKEDGSRAYPVVCMVANLAKPTPTRPALMDHTDVVTFFHEMGHAFHGLCSKTEFAKFHGTSVARDFVEAPSQMLENWCWTPEILKEMSSHFERPDEHLSDEMIASLIASKSVNQGLFNLRQIFFAKFDMTVHTAKEDQDLTKLWCDLRESTSLVSTAGEYVPGQSGFAHIVGGYAAGYYGYLYSQSFSADMFHTVFAKNPMDPAKGKLYREKILQPGGSREEMDSLVDFLGREPTSDAFLRELLKGAESS